MQRECFSDTASLAAMRQVEQGARHRELPLDQRFGHAMPADVEEASRQARLAQLLRHRRTTRALRLQGRLQVDQRNVHGRERLG